MSILDPSRSPQHELKKSHQYTAVCPVTVRKLFLWRIFPCWGGELLAKSSLSFPPAKFLKYVTWQFVPGRKDILFSLPLNKA